MMHHHHQHHNTTSSTTTTTPITTPNATNGIQNEYVYQCANCQKKFVGDSFMIIKEDDDMDTITLQGEGIED